MNALMPEVKGECDASGQKGPRLSRWFAPCDSSLYRDALLDLHRCPACGEVADQFHRDGWGPIPCIGPDPCLPAFLVGEDCGGGE